MIYHRDTGYVDMEGQPLMDIQELEYFSRGEFADPKTGCIYWCYVLRPKGSDSWVIHMPYKVLNLNEIQY